MKIILVALVGALAVALAPTAWDHTSSAVPCRDAGQALVPEGSSPAHGGCDVTAGAVHAFKEADLRGRAGVGRGARAALPSPQLPRAAAQAKAQLTPDTTLRRSPLDAHTIGGCRNTNGGSAFP